MRKAALLYNPDSGGTRRRQRELQTALTVLQSAGVEADLLLTHSQEDARDQARRAIAEGCDTVFACGGDGTINNIAQVLATTPVALGIFPMGTANALAHDLGLPIHLAEAAKAALHGRHRRIALGRITCQSLAGVSLSKYFVLAAGVGVDAHLFYKLHSGAKQRLGMTAYYSKAWNMWWTYRMARFSAEYFETGAAALQKAEVTEVLAVRIRQFGNIVRELAPGASLDRDDMRLILCKTASRFAYISYVAGTLLRRPWIVPGIELIHSPHFRCDYPSNSSPSQRKIYVEADGELIGSLPAEFTMVLDALTLLAPAKD
jgi:YegS/Rv2252/BmrU family lipid kinase